MRTPPVFFNAQRSYRRAGGATVTESRMAQTAFVTATAIQLAALLLLVVDPIGVVLVVPLHLSGEHGRLWLADHRQEPDWLAAAPALVVFFMAGRIPFKVRTLLAPRTAALVAWGILIILLSTIFGALTQGFDVPSPTRLLILIEFMILWMSAAVLWGRDAVAVIAK